MPLIKIIFQSIFNGERAERQIAYVEPSMLAPLKKANLDRPAAINTLLSNLFKHGTMEGVSVNTTEEVKRRHSKDATTYYFTGDPLPVYQQNAEAVWINPNHKPAPEVTDRAPIVVGPAAPPAPYRDPGSKLEADEDKHLKCGACGKQKKLVSTTDSGIRVCHTCSTRLRRKYGETWKGFTNPIAIMEDLKEHKERKKDMKMILQAKHKLSMILRFDLDVDDAKIDAILAMLEDELSVVD